MSLEHLNAIKKGFKHQGKLISVEDISYVEGAKKMRLDYKLKILGIILSEQFSLEFKYEIETIDCVGIGPLQKKIYPEEIGSIYQKLKSVNL